MTERDASVAAATSSCLGQMRTMFERRRCRLYCLVLMSLFLFGFVYLGYFCPDHVCALSAGPTPPYNRPYPSYDHQLTVFNVNDQLDNHEFQEKDLNRNYEFTIEGKDVLVFLHVQKTGGTTFGRHLVHNIDVDIPCQCYDHRKKCDCENSKNHIWLFSRYSTGWACGLHADWTELQDCVNTALNKQERLSRNRRYLYITILRDPISRYLSEWRHVYRGATWLGSRLNCNGRQATLEEVPFCFEEETWQGVTLDEFVQCPYNLGNNRQARMLANLSLVGCYNHSAMTPEERDRVILRSAKKNLRMMAFFGLTEYQADTQFMFEKTFHLEFLEDFVQHNETHASGVDLDSAQYAKILEVNKLDIELYKYAKDLFFQRLRKMREEDKSRTKVAGSPPRPPNKTKHTPVNYEYEESDYEEEEDDIEEPNKRRSSRQTGRLRHRG